MNAEVVTGDVVEVLVGIDDTMALVPAPSDTMALVPTILELEGWV